MAGPAAPGSVIAPRPVGEEAGAFKTRPPKNTDVMVTINSIRVKPLLRGVQVNFRAIRGLTATVSIGQRVRVPRGGGPPEWGDSTILTLPARELPGRGTATIAEYHVRHTALEQAMTYRYTITVPRTDGGTPHTKSGEFTTLASQARVVFTSIHILSDSDDEGAGELTFTLVANPGEKTGRRTHLYSRETHLSWDSGVRYRIQRELIVDAPPRLLRLVAIGTDDDSFSGCLIALDAFAVRYDEVPHRKFGCGDEVNVARGEFDIGQPSPTGSIPFTLRSMLPRDKSITFAFDVGGYIEVIYPKEPTE